jgi:ESCRT-I complex subunit TSG101
MSDNDEIPVDDLVMVGCPLFRQLLNSYSEDAAIDDYIYYMGEALRQGVVDCETFLKNTRNSSRKQFVLRLTMQKCRAKAGLDVE